MKGIPLIEGEACVLQTVFYACGHQQIGRVSDNRTVVGAYDDLVCALAEEGSWSISLVRQGFERSTLTLCRSYPRASAPVFKMGEEASERELPAEKRYLEFCGPYREMAVLFAFLLHTIKTGNGRSCLYGYQLSQDACYEACALFYADSLIAIAALALRRSLARGSSEPERTLLAQHGIGEEEIAIIKARNSEDLAQDVLLAGELWMNDCKAVLRGERFADFLRNEAGLLPAVQAA